jgi:hypothetical protein
MAEKEQGERHKGDRSLDTARTVGTTTGSILGAGCLGLLFYLVYTRQTEDMGAVIWPLAVMLGVAVGTKVLGTMKLPWPK